MGFSYIDNFLNKITMYKLVLYGLVTLSFISILLGFLGYLDYSGLSQILSLLILLCVCYVANYLFCRFLEIEANVESVWISAYILFFVLAPISSFPDVAIHIVSGVLAMASKYILAIGKKHIFNPVAISVFILGLFGVGSASWWVGNKFMLLPVLLLGLLVIRKLIRVELFLSFLVSSLLVSSLFGYLNEFSLEETILSNVLSGPLLFFGFIMLTEPATTPVGKKLRVTYGIITGVLFGSQFSLGPFYSTPELALVLANLFSFVASPRVRLDLILKEKNKLTEDTYEFVWQTKEKINFNAGQYLEWTLAHKHPDNRGNRRYFTVSSSPTEESLSLGIKFYESPSSFKSRLVSMEVGDKIVAGGLSGDFILPDDKSKKLVFIAGGIGVTPFRSMIKYLVDKKEKRNVVMFFSNKTSKDIVYKDVFDEAVARKILKICYVCNSKLPDDTMPEVRMGLIDENMIKSDVPDYLERMFYISGPHGMVSAFESTLSKLGVPRKNIKVDFFPGYV
ncbi:MAG: RnfABCDGE type electron transport complex subunit D [Minisyncoccia bacterium]